MYFLDQDARFLEIGERLGRFVGIAENHGDALTYWILTSEDQLLAWSVVCTATATEPNQRASTSTESKGSIIAPMEPDTRRKGSPTLQNGPTTTLDLMSDLVGGSADFNPIPYLRYSFVRADAHDIPHKTTVIDVDEETGRVLLEYVHGQTEWVEPNILQEALLSREANDDGTNL